MKSVRKVLQYISMWSLHRHQPGQGLVEYAMILSFVAVFVVAALMHLQPAISTSLNMTGNVLINSAP
jgi:Flp pilus assembly pilin Flp